MSASYRVKLRVCGVNFPVTLTPGPQGVRWATKTAHSTIEGTSFSAALAMATARDWLQTREDDEIEPFEDGLDDANAEILLEASLAMARLRKETTASKGLAKACRPELLNRGVR